MKRQLPLIIGILGLSPLIGFPARAQNRVEDLFHSISHNRFTVNDPLTHSRHSQTLVAEAPPAPSGNLVEETARSNQFQIFAAAVKATGLTETLSNQGPYTIFAPTDQAFAALPAGTREQLLKPENKDLLLQVLGYHVVLGEITTSQLKPGRIETISGKSVAVRVRSTGEVTLDRAEMIQPQIQASNGIIYAINRVILPPQILAQMNTAPNKAPNQAD